MTPMPPLDEAACRELAEAFRQQMAQYAPAWSEANRGDPGVTLLELFAYVAESLLYCKSLPELGRTSAARLAELALSLANPHVGCGSTDALERPRYFAGQLLSADDFRLEQDYFRSRFRRHQRELHGFGITRGLEVSLHHAPSATGDRVVVAPGFALDQSGEEIEVRGGAEVALPDRGQTLYVILLHSERPSRPQLTGKIIEYDRIREEYAVILAPTNSGTGVALARLQRGRSRWRKDPAFQPPRVA
jgi:hypothetical protein